MSQTFTLPITAGDHFIHGHENKQSKHRRHSRLALPFQLPRIPSGEVPFIEEVPLNPHHDRPNHNHNYSISSVSSSDSLKVPNYDINGPLVVKKRSFDIVSTQAVPAKMGPSHNHVHSGVSKATRILLNATENYPLLHGILADHDSRRIFYFMLLNLAFMGVQSTYGFLTGSLGLISDSIHMFFDCVALFVGVCAAVMSKWPPSAKFPYGYGKIDTLAGLGNGIFLMLISVEIVYEAVERLFTGSDLSRTTELLVVSLAGLAVNLVGIMAFHSHHGHDHGHGHSHSHSHHHSHDHSHNHGPSSSASSSSGNSPIPAHSHALHPHHGDNMQGIYLHIMADALGSVAVVISTVLVQLTGWSGFDPLASCIIAVLIFISTVPLVSSTIRILLLSLNDDVEYNLRDTLGGISDIRGVVGYTVPKFWLEDVKKVDAHNHSHSSAHETHISNDASAHHGHDHDGHDHHHDHHSHGHSQQHSDRPKTEPQVLGVVHIQISSSASLSDVQARIARYFGERKMDVVVQYEREGENRCWCTGNSGATAAMNGGVNKKSSYSSLAYEFGKKP